MTAFWLFLALFVGGYVIYRWRWLIIIILDCLFSRFRIYRRMRGGKWSQLGPCPGHDDLGFFWVRGETHWHEKVYDREDHR